MTIMDKYEAVIGLEIHAQLSTESKLFCGDATSFGAAPNTHISPITLGHPGTLPKTNTKAIEYAIKMGLACGCKIAEDNYFARKNYFYPDLPKGYQISQHTTPICVGGNVLIQTNEGEKIIQLNRIHLEEDAGKSIHDVSPTHTLIDLNRAGTPLIEMVTEPCIHSAEDAFLYVTEVEKSILERLPCDLPKIWVHNKIDLTEKPSSIQDLDGASHIHLSAKTGDGVQQLRETLLKIAGWQSTNEGVFMARTRHLYAIQQVELFLQAALDLIDQSEIVAENLRMAQESLSSVTGEFTPDDLLGEIFSKFCIGK